MEHLLPTVEQAVAAHSDLVCASIAWTDLKNRSLRCGDRDAQLLAKRDAVMESICEAGGLLDRLVAIGELQGVGSEL